PPDRLGVFKVNARTLGKAVSDRWLPKDVVIARLQGIANEHGLFGQAREQLSAIIAESVGKVELPPIDMHSKQKRRRLISHRASELEPEKLVWVWPGRIPEGKLVLLGGPPGLGKSQLTAFMSATVSNGGHWPCGEGAAVQGDAIILSAEDGIADTI